MVGFSSRPRSSRTRIPAGRRRYGIRQVLSLVIHPVPLLFCRRSLLLRSHVLGLAHTRSETVPSTVVSICYINQTHNPHHGRKHAPTVTKLSGVWRVGSENAPRIGNVPTWTYRIARCPWQMVIGDPNVRRWTDATALNGTHKQRSCSRARGGSGIR